jgi:tyrosinase
MVSRYTTAPIELPHPAEPFVRADLIFYGLDHSRESYEGRVFVDAPTADADLPREGDLYAGSFWIFGHGGCFGDVGHCDVPVRDDPFDLRPPHQLTPATRTVTVTDAIKRLLDAGETATTVSVVAHTAEDAPNDVLAFEKVRLATYA